MLTKKQIIILVSILVLLILGISLKNLANKNKSPFKDFKVSSFFMKKYTIREIKFQKNVFNPNMKKLKVKIILPSNLKKEKITNNLKAATIELYKTKNMPVAIEIFAYNKKDDLKGDYTIAKSNFKINPNKTTSFNIKIK